MNWYPLVALALALCSSPAPSAEPSIARVWDEEILSAIRIDLPNPPVHARNLFHLSVAMYDAWAAYDPVAVGYLFHEKRGASDVASARREAISYAAYRILAERYALSRNAKTTLATLADRLAALGYDKDNLTLDPSTPAGLGNRVAAVVSAYFLDDGALQSRGYQDLPAGQGGYQPVNPLLDVGAAGISTLDVNRWQPLLVTNAVAQNGDPIPSAQKFLGAQWLGVRPFALARADVTRPWIDPGPPPHLGGDGDAAFRTNVIALLQRSSELTPDDGATVDISPGAFGNNSLGMNDGKGHPLNPATGLPYAPNVVRRGDFARVLAEYWADGPDSETPPGHWNLLANEASDDPIVSKRVGGTGPALDNLEWDVKLYFTLNGALHDAACAAWSLKRVYDGWRPVSAIRYMGQRGQSSDVSLPSYDPDGLPLVPGLVELVTAETSRPGGRHEGLDVDTVAVHAWPGQPPNLTNQYGGVRWISATAWVPYQRKTFVTPAFPGYISGHSTFSRAAAEVLTAFTGSAFFPGGMGSYSVPATNGLRFEMGPSQAVQLQWATYYDAADQAGLSRIWGGIHPPVDDFTGRRAGAQSGQAAWALARRYFDGSIANASPTFILRPLNATQCELRCDTVRGFFYKTQSTPDLRQPFRDDPAGFFQAVDAGLVRVDTFSGGMKFYRVIMANSP